MNPDSLTVHSLAIKRAARLNMFKEDYEGLTIQNTPEMIDLSAACARELGMEPYYLYRQKNMAGNFENVGYALPGKACIYNILIMEEMQTIVACGAGTTTKVVFPAENRREKMRERERGGAVHQPHRRDDRPQGADSGVGYCNSSDSSSS